ncbi:otoferlin-like [Penaeus japonicus]|uniref:otoferlin-like n=1 Tax=Penaeus japonicus TaxID=27405 RepID=UPI001C710A70|nr:otoferlin-like [Penaeus japonicus]
MWHSTTPPMKPMTNDKIYYFLPFWDDKPCLYIRSFFQDHRRRLYNSNAIAAIALKLEEGLSEVSSLMEEEDGSAERRLKEVLEEMMSGCGQYLSIARASSAASTGGRTKLDKERMRLCQREIVSGVGYIDKTPSRQHFPVSLYVVLRSISAPVEKFPWNSSSEV